MSLEPCGAILEIGMHEYGRRALATKLGEEFSSLKAKE